MIFRKKIILAVMFLLLTAVSAQPQDNTNQPQDGTAMRLPRWNIKTNLLYDATATVNLGLEFRLGKHASLDLPFNYNGWTSSENQKWQHLLAQPELRLWTRETFRGHFFGLHGHYANYNVGHLKNGSFSEYMQTHRLEGWLAGAGISYGYRWNFNHRWALEATLGMGYAYMVYEKYNCENCTERISDVQKHYIGPTKAGITLIYGIGGKKAVKPKSVQMQAPTYVAQYYTPVAPVTPIVEEPKQKAESKPQSTTPVILYEAKLRPTFVIPEAEAVKARSVSGKARLDYVAGQTEIVPGLRDNATELHKIHTLIDAIKKDPDVTITAVTITGYTSPEGTWGTNQTLSESRAQTLKSHIANIHGLQQDIFRVWGAGEDWATLDTLVEQSGMTEKYRILEIIRGTDIFAGRESKLMTLGGGNAYREMRALMFPQLHRLDYSIQYTIAPYTIEQGKERLRVRPGNLSLNEMFLIAGTYKPGSDAYNEIFETAARIYPANDVANINAAASALGRNDSVSAAYYLGRVKEHADDYWNNMGILAWSQGDKEKATEYFAKGGIQGARNAVELEKSMNR